MALVQDIFRRNVPSQPAGTSTSISMAADALASRMVRSEEWGDMTRDVGKGYHRSQIFMFYGLTMEVLSPEERIELEKEIPLPIKVMYALIGRRQYERIMHNLRPTA
jgi:hypothetical protein